MESALPGEVSARCLAAAALERGSLVEHYPSEFATRLADPMAGEQEVFRTVAAWIDAGGSYVSRPLGADEIYLALALVSREVAKEFARVHPEASGFDRICATFTDRLTHEDKERWDELVGRTPTLADRRHQPAMARAIEGGEAEFSLVSEARAYQQKKFFPRNEIANRTYRRFYLPVRTAFEARHGHILEEYWCDEVAVGVVRTAGGPSQSKLHFDGDYDDTVSEVINRCKEVHRKGREFLPTPEYETLVGELYGLLTDLFASMDRVAVLGTDGNSTYNIDQGPYLERIEEIETNVENGTSRRGQRWYIAGTVIGLTFLSTVLALLAMLSLGDWQRIFEGAIFGAAGALASVLYRMHRGELSIDAQQGRLLVYVGALVKPLTGALFGGVISALLLSSLLPIEVPSADPQRFYFLGVLAFVAGLSERWAPDLLQLTADRISTEVKPKDDESVAQALTPTM